MLSVVQPAAIQVMYSSLVLCQTQLNGSATQSCCLSVCLCRKKTKCSRFLCCSIYFSKNKSIKISEYLQFEPWHTKLIFINECRWKRTYRRLCHLAIIFIWNGKKNVAVSAVKLRSSGLTSCHWLKSRETLYTGKRVISAASIDCEEETVAANWLLF